MNSIVLVISHIVSLITISLSFISKVPQILTLYNAGTSAGLSLSALMLELSSYSTTMMYNFTNGYAILTYLEYPILLIQEFIIIGFVLHYKGYKFSFFTAIMLFYGGLYTLFEKEILSKVILQVLLPFTVPIGALSKGMQFMEIVRRQNADSVSTLTWFLSVFTNMTRIFTVFVDSADTTLLLNFSISSVCSAAVLCAAIYYKRQTQLAKKE